MRTKCPICEAEFDSPEELSKHFVQKRKNAKHAEYINHWIKESFYHDDPLIFLKSKFLYISKQSMNEKWKRWFTTEDRQKHGVKILRLKNSGKTLDAEARRKVGDGVKKAYSEGRKQPPMKGKIPHNKGVKCNEEMKKRISKTLRRKYADGEIKISSNGNNCKYGFRDDIGHFVRSSWEANIARFFISLNLIYAYERYTFKLKYKDEVMAYIPDFYIPKTKTFIEVKGLYRGKSKLKIQLFKKQFPHIKLCVIDRQKYFKLEQKLRNIVPGWEYSKKL